MPASPPALPKDPLLTFTLVVTRIIAVLLAAAAVAALLAIGFIAIDMASGSPVLAGEYPGLDPALVRGHIFKLLALAGLGFAVAAAFMHQLSRIVASVAGRDPFDAINARRLYRMAWLALAFQLIAIPVRLSENAFNRLTESGGTDTAIGFGGFVLALTLFVLARVFAHGAAMRDDLEGTV